MMFGDKTDQNIEKPGRFTVDRPLEYQNCYARNVSLLMFGLRLAEAVHILVLRIDVYCIVHVHCCSNCQARGLELFAASSAVDLCLLRQIARAMRIG